MDALYLLRFLLDLSLQLSKLMYKLMLKLSLLLLVISNAFGSEVINSYLKIQAPIQSQVIGSESQFKNSDDSIFSNPLIIALIALVSFNLFVFILIYGCRRCLRLPFQVNQDETRENFGQRYPNLKFESHSHCLTQGQVFYGKDCFERSEVITILPAFIYGREIDPEISHLDYFTIRQCERCGGLTRTLEVFKYGKLRECWETLFMILISPCFLAFTIHRITANSILWRKFFCTECGFEKRVQK